ncbi:MAG: 4-(cytidine 5'-diphospho)-2-C-methyl-D-erythritol kinase [Clostridia bacterium]|nr:4-(cytidine 5'-diphospho)-2-C-methyl-D-erythritol kinase [Clostridia bacterium]
MKVTLKAYAKINLLLDILGLLDNGYHNLYMLMQSIGLFDVVSVESTDDEKIQLTCSVSDIPIDQKNIAFKAVKAFFDYTGLKNPGIKIHIEKNIPHAAGLAGGSADGAAVVTALKTIFSPDLSDREIVEICTRFGSDVPFCALGGTMLAQGSGTILSYMPQLDLKNIIVVKPDCSVSTGEAYSAFDTASHIRHPDRNGIFQSVIDGDYEKLFSLVDNVFEQFIDVPERITIKAIMRKHSAKCACMSGSGPSVFGVFENEKDAESCYNELKKQFERTYLCSSKKCGIEIISVEK